MNNNTLKYYQTIINKEISTILNDNIIFDSNLKASMVYSLKDGGKRLRPALFLSLLDSYNIKLDKYVKVACAIEMIHTYSLIHDDLPGMDNDTLRHGKLTTHVRFDESTAILCGDALLTDAFYLLSTLELDDSLLIKLIRSLSYAAGSNGMVYGQQLDLEEDEASNAAYIKNVYHFKTSMMLQTSIVMAAIIADQNLDKFLELGAYLGQVFQIQDDILELTKSSSEIGKNNDSDQKNNKITFINIYGYNNTIAIRDTLIAKINKIINELSLHNTNFELIINDIFNRQF
ncbi:MAG: polyprenyl synthetase family protein [Bacilli bacterium]|jgi:geranylgeranyl diphosphate synthase type II|nr:polyprenyl synthetase family protein [Bacilli bacterium]